MTPMLDPWIEPLIEPLKSRSFPRRLALRAALVFSSLTMVCSGALLTHNTRSQRAPEVDPQFDVFINLLTAYPINHHGSLLGKAYLQSQPRVNELTLKQRLISRESLWIGLTHNHSQPELSVALKQEIQQDFLRGATTLLDGWCFANVELELCALTYLQTNPMPSHSA